VSDFWRKNIIFAKLEGSLAGPNTWSFKGSGWIFDKAGCEAAIFDVSGSRANNPGETRSLTLLSGDKIMQFTTADITLDSDAPAEFTTRQKITGTATGAISGSFILDSNALIITGGTYAGRGFSVARFTFTGSPDTMDGFLILDNTNYGVHSGFVIGVSGTGKFANKIIVGSFSGTFTSPPNYYDYSGSGFVNICSLPPPIGGEIMTQNIKVVSSGISTVLWIFVLVSMTITIIIVMIVRRK